MSNIETYFSLQQLHFLCYQVHLDEQVTFKNEERNYGRKNHNKHNCKLILIMYSDVGWVNTQWHARRLRGCCGAEAPTEKFLWVLSTHVISNNYLTSYFILKC